MIRLAPDEGITRVFSCAMATSYILTTLNEYLNRQGFIFNNVLTFFKYFLFFSNWLTHIFQNFISSMNLKTSYIAPKSTTQTVVHYISTSFF